MGGERKVERRSTFLISSTSTLHCRHLDLGCNALLCRLQLFFGNLALHSFLVFCVFCCVVLMSSGSGCVLWKWGVLGACPGRYFQDSFQESF